MQQILHIFFILASDQTCHVYGLDVTDRLTLMGGMRYEGKVF